ncbi:hypothetical protein WJX84_006145 [Apatococcus fuscideae]|uniref:Uncharacterized protein n=1 Tax=Apatococcus fuscideae TaxID=2026836 RepID=A0AAW1SWS4_9CHLO
MATATPAVETGFRPSPIVETGFRNNEANGFETPRSWAQASDPAAVSQPESRRLSTLRV